MLQAISHLGATGDHSYMPWTGTEEQDYPYMGWRLEFLDPDEPPAFFYLRPKVDEPNPHIEVYFGQHGDHTKDHMIGNMEGTDETETDNE